jgi:hypothetical protein
MKIITKFSLKDLDHTHWRYIMEAEIDGHLPFLDTVIYRRVNGSLGHTTHRKHTHINLCLNARLHHHPVNKNAVLIILTCRAKTIYNQDSLHTELDSLQRTFGQNRYSNQQILHTLNPPEKVKTQIEDPTSVACLPFVRYTFISISSVLSHHNIKTVGIPQRKVSSLLWPIKP